MYYAEEAGKVVIEGACWQLKNKKATSESCRVRADDAELMGAPFLLPPEALSPQATAEVPAITPAATAAATPATAGDGLDDLFGPAVPVPGSEFLAGTGLETLEAPAKDYSSFGETWDAFRLAFELCVSRM